MSQSDYNFDIAFLLWFNGTRGLPPSPSIIGIDQHECVNEPTRLKPAAP